MEIEPIILPIIQGADKKKFSEAKNDCLFDCEECSKVLCIILKWNGWSEKKRIKNGLKRAKLFNSVPLWSFALNNVKHTVHKITCLCETHSAQNHQKWRSNESPGQQMTNLPPLEIQLGKETKESWLRKKSVWWKVPTNQLHRPEWGS